MGQFWVDVNKEAPKDAYIGSRGSVEGLRQLVERASRSVSLAGEQLKARGYDLDQLDRDNPYNAWMESA